MNGSISRRGLLRTAGGFAAGAALGGALGRPAYAATGSDGDFSITATSLALSQRIDLTQGAITLIREKALHRASVMQSFAIDNINKRIYAAQVVDDPALGNLCITQMDMAGNKLGYMYLKGFGHGVQIGVEPSGTAAYLWTETGSVGSRGTAIARFKFVNGVTLSNTSSALEKHVPVPGSTNNTCSIDPTTNRLIFRYFVSGLPMYRVYNLGDVRARNYTPLVEVAEPYIVGNAQSFQGYAAIGRFLYLLEGSNYGSPGSVYPTGNTHLTCVDLNTGTLVDRRLTQAGYTLSYREPEGMGVHLPTPSDPSTARLCMGFASGESGARKASIYYKDRKISGTWPRNLVAGDVAMVKAASGVCVSYRVGTDGAIWGSQQGSAGGTYGAWGRVSGAGMFTGRPTATLTMEDTIAVYALGVDRNVWGVGQDSPGAAFGLWSVIGTNYADVDLVTEPSAVVAANGATALYALGSDGWIWGVQASLGAPFGGWWQIGGSGGSGGFASRPQAYPGAAFSPWSIMGTNTAPLTGDPSAILNDNRTLVIHSPDSDDWIWGTSQTSAGGSFGNWIHVGG